MIDKVWEKGDKMWKFSEPVAMPTAEFFKHLAKIAKIRAHDLEADLDYYKQARIRKETRISAKQCLETNLQWLDALGVRRR